MRRWTATSASTCPPRRPSALAPRAPWRLISGVALAGTVACAARSRPPRDPASPVGESQPAAVDPRGVGAVVVLGVELPPAGAVVGSHYQGVLYDVRRSAYSLTSDTRGAWAAAARQHAEALLHDAGFTVRSVAPVTSASRRADEARFGIRGRAISFSFQSSGQSEPFLVVFTAELSWEVTDLSSGAVIFTRTTLGTARQRGEVDAAALAALDQALQLFLGDGALARALAARAGSDSGAVESFTRPPLRRDEIVSLGPGDRNPSEELTPVTRVAEGLARLSGPGGGYYGTAILLSRDGLGITTMRAARALSGLTTARARLHSGLELPVRLVRTSRSRGVALIQVACPGDCPTVDWDLPARVEPFTPVLVVGAGEEAVGTLSVRQTTVGGRWGLARGVSLGARVQDGGAVAPEDDGRVFGIVVTVGERRIVMMLGEVLRSLKVRPAGPAAS